MKKKIILLFLFVLASFSGQAQYSVSFSTPVTGAEIGTVMEVHFTYSAPATCNVYAGISLKDDWTDVTYINGNGPSTGNPLPAGENVNGTIYITIPSNITPTADLTGNLNYKIKIEISDASWNWQGGDYPATGLNFTAPTVPPVDPAISFNPAPTSTQVGSDLIVNYKYSLGYAGKVKCKIELYNGWTWLAGVGYTEVAVSSGTNQTGSLNVPIPGGTTPRANLESGQNYRVILELTTASDVWLVGDYSIGDYNLTPAATYTYYADADADGYGAGAAILLTASTAPTGYSVNNTDCNDSNPAINPGATEIFDTLDNDCDGLTDEGTTLGAPVVANTGICKGTVGATPTATALPGYTLVWYKDGTTTTALATAPVITATKTYFVAQKLGATTSPRVSVTTTVNDLPITPSPLVLTNGSEVIKKVGNFIGTTTALLLTATPVGTVDHYNWTLPTGVNQTAGGSTNTITINFATVDPGNTSLDLLVSSVSAEGCVSKTAKKLTVARSEPGKPKGLTLTDALLPGVLKITKLDAYTGVLKTRTLTLTATENTKAGSQATSYKWVLPAAATVVGGTATLVDTNTYTSTLPTITINLANVGSETTFLFQVYAVNGNGTSLLSKDLTCTSAAPKTPAIVASPSTTFNVCSTRTYTTTDQLGATFNWTVPAGASIVGASTGNVIVVDFSSVTTASSYAVTCSASNGTNTSVVKSLTIKRAATCAKIAPEEVIADDFSAIAYPNPSSEEFTIEASRKGANVKVYDMTGRLIENRQATSNSVQVGRNFASGIYNVIVSQGGKAKTLKVIKR